MKLFTSSYSKGNLIANPVKDNNDDNNNTNNDNNKNYLRHFTWPNEGQNR